MARQELSTESLLLVVINTQMLKKSIFQARWIYDRKYNTDGKASIDISTN